MADAALGYFRRLGRRLTEDIDRLDAEELAEVACASGATKVSDAAAGDEVTLCGRLRSVEACPKAAGASVAAEFFDGTGTVALVWIGRRKIPGIEPGREIIVHGRIGQRDGGRVIYNPRYELQDNTES